ncbi:hypothetical protein PAPYR_4109 [Paratrimastix pyriformis]|uniref:Uncharacterized protein n=1 Tax=Paratrimastix pyriformis TaxID=342808 RepID=A0ABQ8USK0_9EUKA|nr:hypothetical protein PAPYR_4109 [Paratrimastix pyriformis]
MDPQLAKMETARTVTTTKQNEPVDDIITILKPPLPASRRCPFPPPGQAQTQTQNDLGSLLLAALYQRVPSNVMGRVGMLPGTRMAAVPVMMGTPFLMQGGQGNMLMQLPSASSPPAMAYMTFTMGDRRMVGFPTAQGFPTRGRFVFGGLPTPSATLQPTPTTPQPPQGR